MISDIAEQIVFKGSVADGAKELNEILEKDSYYPIILENDEDILVIKSGGIPAETLLEYIKKFPNLKVAAFFDEFPGLHIRDTYIVYSKQGEDYFSECKFIGSWDAKSDTSFSTQADILSVAQEDLSVIHSSTGDRWNITYSFPYIDDWEKAEISKHNENLVSNANAKLWKLREISDNKAFITKYLGTDTDVIFPTKVNDKTIIGIDNRMGKIPDAYKKIISVTIPEGYEIIGKHAFEGCSSLTTVDLPATIEDIRDCAFRNCSLLKSITLGPNLNYLTAYGGKWAFRDCINLTDVFVFNPSLDITGSAAFRGCDMALLHSTPDAVINKAFKKKRVDLTQEEKELFAKKLFGMGVTYFVMTDESFKITKQEISISKTDSNFIISENGNHIGQILFNSKTPKINNIFTDLLTVKVISEKSSISIPGEETLFGFYIRVTLKNSV